jgi:hypothetical protein
MQDFVHFFTHGNIIMVDTITLLLIGLILVTQLTNAQQPNNTNDIFFSIVSRNEVVPTDFYLKDIFSTYTFQRTSSHSISMFFPFGVMLPPKTWPNLCGNGIPNATLNEINTYNEINTPEYYMRSCFLFMNISEMTNDRCSITEKIQNAKLLSNIAGLIIDTLIIPRNQSGC